MKAFFEFKEKLIEIDLSLFGTAEYPTDNMQPNHCAGVCKETCEGDL